MADPKETRTHRDGDALTGSGYRSGLESLTTTPPRGAQQIQSSTGATQSASGADRHDIDD
ncbi:hypothetical protein [Nocardia asteroides]|uniref:hypothetical protein n=1 Tax=Nocardia asteroides TaxID=1824 RepID=UPI0034473379